MKPYMEKQLGIAFAGGEGPGPEALRRFFAGRLRGGSVAGVLTVAADSGLLVAEAAGVRPDWVVGDMDSVGDEGRLLAYPKERVVRHPADKDHTDTELALELLWGKGCERVWIVGGGGGRIAHVFAIRDLFERERFPCRWITSGGDVHCVDREGVHAPSGLTAASEAGDTVSVFPLGGGPWKAESLGLKWPLDKVRWERGLYGLSNIATGNETGIQAIQGRFMIVSEKICQQL